MSQRINYAQAVATLDYAALNQKLERLSQTNPPGSQNNALAMLEPLREKLQALHRSGWSSQQLAVELKTAGVPATVARVRECLRHWLNDDKITPQMRKINPAKRANKISSVNRTSRNPSPTGEPPANFKLRES